MGIGTLSPNENLVVGDDIGSYSGTRLTIGNSGGFAGLNIGENSDDRSFILFDPTNHYMYMGTVNGGTLYNNTLVLRDGNVGYGENNPTHPIHMASGAHVTSGGVWTNASDRNKKKDITDQSYGLSEVLQMKPRSYHYRGTGEKSIGFVAQEMEELIPEVVSGEDGEKGIAYGLLVSTLVNAIQEQQAIIEEQDETLLELTGEIKSLKVQMAELQRVFQSTNSNNPVNK